MELAQLNVEELDLDPNNPRLPEDQQGRHQASILKYLEQRDVLNELAASFVGNGYFPNEPIIVSPSTTSPDRWTVVEGNRRVATLIILLQLQPALEAELAFDLSPAPTEERLAELQRIPAYVTSDPASVATFLGYRHISGLRRWSAEAKSRYIWNHVNQARSDGSDNPFYDVGRLVGSNARGIRNAYLAYELLRTAKQSFAIDTDYVLTERFGVWTRLLGTANVLDHIGVAHELRNYDEISNGMTGLSESNLREVVEDLSPRGGNEPVLSDSRDVTVYSRVLANATARAVLREYHDLDLAKQVVEEAALAGRILSLARSCDIIIQDARKLDIDEDAISAAADLAAAADTLLTVLERTAARSRRGTKS